MLIPVVGRGRRISEFEATLVYRASSQIAQGYTLKPCLRKTKTNKKTKQNRLLPNYKTRLFSLETDTLLQLQNVYVHITGVQRHLCNSGTEPRALCTSGKCCATPSYISAYIPFNHISGSGVFVPPTPPFLGISYMWIKVWFWHVVNHLKTSPLSYVL